MSDESKSFDPYEVVINDLKAKRDEIDNAIQALERLRAGGGGTPAMASGAGGHSPVPSEGPGAYLGMTIPEAVIKLLRTQRRQMSNTEIVAAIQAGGLAMQSKDPINTVGSVLTRRFNDVGDIVRVGRGIWGLAEWYPNRNFKKKPDKADNGSKNGTSEPEQPSGPLGGALE